MFDILSFRKTLNDMFNILHGTIQIEKTEEITDNSIPVAIIDDAQNISKCVTWDNMAILPNNKTEPIIPKRSKDNNTGKIIKKKSFVSKATLIAPTTKDILLPTEFPRIGMIVYAKIKGKYIQHKINTIDPKKGIEIFKKGHSNGWVKRVYTKINVI
jgi:hypothetical protein